MNSCRSLLVRSTVLAIFCGLLVLWPADRARAAYESEMAAFAAQDAANPPPADVIVFTGSSSITGWSGLKAAFPGYPVLNRGFGGSQMHDVLEHFADVITPYRAPLIVLYEGDNDIWAGETPAAIFAEYVTFVDRVAAEQPDTDIILIAVKPSPSRVSRMAAMAELNGMLRDLCTARPNLRYADVFTPMLNSSGQPRPELFGSDMLHMNSAGYALWQGVLAPLLAASPFPGRNTFLLDFGASDATPGGAWNNITREIGVNPAGTLSNLTAADLQVSTVTLEMQAAFASLNVDGTTASSIFPGLATRDSLFGNTESFDGQSSIFPRFRLTGLDPALDYRLTFYASRTGVTDNRQTLYTVSGATTGTAVLNATANIDTIATVGGISPDATHGITISLSPGPANNSPHHFTYLGVLKVDGLAPAPADTAAPLLLSAAGRQGRVIELTFNEPMDPDSLSPLTAYTINQGAVSVSAATLLTGGRVLSLTLAQPLSGTVTVEVTGIRDSAGNPVAPGTSITLQMPVAVASVMLFDFGGAGTGMEAADDPSNAWNNVTAAIGGSDTGVLTNLVTTRNEATTAALRMVRRFNGVNTNGTTASTLFPSDATSDTLFGNTEMFNSLSNIFPSFRLTGLDPGQAYDISFYASRTGAGDNRETRYTAAGMNTVTALLQPANNINSMVTASGIHATAQGEIMISLAPGTTNNNVNHFTYLGVMRVSPAPPLAMLPPQLSNTHIQLFWTGTGQLEHSETLAGPWISITPAPQSPFSEALLPAGRRFYRLRPLPP